STKISPDAERIADFDKMSASKLNVLVYTGPGTTVESVRHCLYTLRRLLSPNYAVTPVGENALLKEPWQPTCALLVFPGGADLGFCSVLNGAGNRRITEYVRRGGRFLGFCAGGYYGSARCEFEVGDKKLEVVGRRELAFFPGTCRGCAHKGFEYHSEAGARAAKIKVAKDALNLGDDVQGDISVYYNGGGVFVDAEVLKDKGVEILASYRGELDVDGGQGNAAVVYCPVGQGAAVLTGPHPEFTPANISPQPTVPGYDKLLEEITAHDDGRAKFLRACLAKLGLTVDDTEAMMPSLSSLHLSAMNPSEVDEMLHDWEDIITCDDKGEEFVKCESDTFHIEKRDSRWEHTNPPASAGGSGIVDYGTIVKRLIPHEESWPDTKETPSFHHNVFYTNLNAYRDMEPEAEEWGNQIMYGEVVTSTNTILEKNPTLLSKLPTGFTLIATTQVAGRGRGSNVWLAPPGCLIMSTVINHPAHLAASRPIVFIQYLAAIAVVEAVRSYDRGYNNLDLKVKWPNDVYARDPRKPADPPSYVKIAGILANCSYVSGSYQIVLGIGVNTNNGRPTIDLDSLLPADGSLPTFRIERLIARILTLLESLYAEFKRDGFSEKLETRYYQHWLHSGQKVTLEAEGGVRARVLGITRDWGMLRAEELDGEGKATGKVWALQSDENSFDYWKGLLKRKT
ncbi:hypothetical protein jhhlp_002745, partial [Lomentospora prolificans]